MEISATQTATIPENLKKAADYSELLDDYGFVYSKEEPYLVVGEVTKPSGWILELSVIRSQLNDLINRVIPIFYMENIGFRIIQDPGHARHILDGDYGNQHVRRLIAIYPETDCRALHLARILIQGTTYFKRPAIPRNIILGGLIYTYDSSKKKPNCWPFKELTPRINRKSKLLLKNSYLRFSTIHSSAKGNVEKEILIKPIWKMNWCLVKQGKSGMLSDDLSCDMCDRLKWQKTNYDSMKGILPLPEIIDLVEENGDQFLIMEFIEGQTLENIVIRHFDNKTWHSLETGIRLSIFTYLLEIIQIVGKMQQEELIHRDITPANFLIDKKNKLFFIDLELAYSVKYKYPLLPFELRTYGYISPGQLAKEIPSYQDDIYTIGCLMIALFTCCNPIKFSLSEIIALKEKLCTLIGDKLIVDLIVQCLAPDPSERPALQEIKTVITTLQQRLK